jgi:hypothetical protein
MPTRDWWRTPLRADPWRRTLYSLLALPAGIAAAPLALAGGYRAAARWQRDLARRLLRLPLERSAGRERAGRVLAHSLLSLPLNVASFALTVSLWSLVLLNLAYPLRPALGIGDGDYETAWGGPTLVGAWAVHAAGGLLLLFVSAWTVTAVTGLQGRLLRRLLGAGPAARPATPARRLG